MSNEYKEWEKDRAEEAWNDINKIAEIAELDNHANTEECFYKIVNVLKEGGWL